MKLRKFINEVFESGILARDIKIWREYYCPTCSCDWKEYVRHNDNAIDYCGSNFNITDFDAEELELSITINTIEDKMCNTCSNANYAKSSEYKQTYANAEWRNSCFHHGIAAFNTEMDIDDSITRIEDIKNCNEMQICCSTEAIGPCGVTCSGEVLVASNSDALSIIDRDTFDRLVNTRYLQQVKNIDDFNDSNSCTEIIVRYTTIEAIWYKSYISSTLKEQLRQKAKELNCFCYELNSYE